MGIKANENNNILINKYRIVESLKHESKYYFIYLFVFRLAENKMVNWVKTQNRCV